MIYGYARVSTRKQKDDGTSLESQVRVLTENGAVEVYADAYTGTKRVRPELSKLLAKLESGDTLMVTKLDRVARSMVQGVELIDELLEKGVRVNILNLGVMDNTPSSKLIRNVFFAFAEFERDMIRERLSEGKQAARDTDPDYREGRPPAKVDRIKEMDNRVKRGELSVVAAVEELGISRATWYKYVS